MADTQIKTIQNRLKEMAKTAGTIPEKSPYFNLTFEQLKQTEKTADIWLKTHLDHPQYQNALARYKSLVRVLNLKTPM